MKKILLALDGDHFSKGVADFILSLNEEQPFLLTGVFLKSFNSPAVYTDIGVANLVNIPSILENERELMEENISRFEEFCVEQNFEFRVHNNFDESGLDALIKETRFADLFMISSELFYQNLEKHQPNSYLKEVLHRSECPLLLIPEQYEVPKKIIFAYDGSQSSVFSIRQFAYLFPDLSRLPSLLVNMSDEPEIPDASLIEELAARHFSDLTILKMDFDPREHFDTWLLGEKNTLLVTGAYGRAGISEALRKSFINQLIGEKLTIIFVAHH